MTKAVLYRGERLPGRLDVWRVFADGRRELLTPKMDLRLHSPNGFDWGVYGEDGGCRQLALAILADAVGDAAAVALHEVYAIEVVSALSQDRWELQRVHVVAWAGGSCVI